MSTQANGLVEGTDETPTSPLEDIIKSATAPAVQQRSPGVEPHLLLAFGLDAPTVATNATGAAERRHRKSLRFFDDFKKRIHDKAPTTSALLDLAGEKIRRQRCDFAKLPVTQRTPLTGADKPVTDGRRLGNAFLIVD